MRSVGVSKLPVADTAFCCASAANTTAGSMPKVASLALASSTKIFSSCSPTRSTLATSFTRRSWLRMRSAVSFSCAYVKPSPVSA